MVAEIISVIYFALHPYVRGAVISNAVEKRNSIELIHLPAELHFVELRVTGKPNFLWRASRRDDAIFPLFGLSLPFHHAARGAQT
ncbi:hypothetical protein [Mixta gaviniae]|uniref:hypothetical protein n=1 Tax=Mixta gaviniae TaxID=665914 RepID=UPI0010081D2D|nr:hypothetical protein [Mixta gaviniae]